MIKDIILVCGIIVRSGSFLLVCICMYILQQKYDFGKFSSDSLKTE